VNIFFGIELNEEKDNMLKYIAYYEKNLLPTNNRNNPPRVANFAYQLSLQIPQATILASTNRTKSSNGLNAPIVYQNGLAWFIPYPDKKYKGENVEFLNSTFNSTIHPLDNLCD
jgi:hypothetical protein